MREVIRALLLVPLAAALLVAAPALADEQPLADSAAPPPSETAAPVAPPPAALPAVVDEIETPDLYFTRRWVLLRELPWKPGESVTPEQWELGLTRLWNTGLYSQLDASLRTENGRTIARFKVEERITLNQIFRFARGGDLFWLRLGLTDNNLLAQFQEIGAAWEYFRSGPVDFNGGMLWWKNPRLFDRRLSLLVHTERLVRPRPQFTLGRTLGRLELSGEVHDHLRLTGRFEAMDDQFFDASEGPTIKPHMSSSFVLTGTVRFGLLETVRLRQRSWTIEVEPGVGYTTDTSYAFWPRLWTQVLWFHMLGDLFNVAVRAQAAVMGAAPAQNRFFVGGLDLVRGLIDSQIRTTAYALANVELRMVAFDSMWFAVMPALFVDAVVAASETGGAVAVATAGGGARFLIPRLVGTGFRLDIAVPIAWPVRPDWSIGVFQFF